jgi:hypothetical protein
MNRALETLPRRIFFGFLHGADPAGLRGFIHEGKLITDADQIHRVPDGVANLDALGNVFLVSEGAMFEWIVSERSLHEARDKAIQGLG